MVRLLRRFARQQRLLFVALGLAGVGGEVFTNLRIEAYPDISDTQAVVISLYHGHAEEEVALISGIGEMYRYRLEGAAPKGSEDTMKRRELRDFTAWRKRASSWKCERW
jgi:hypothetical protein